MANNNIQFKNPFGRLSALAIPLVFVLLIILSRSSQMVEAGHSRVVYHTLGNGIDPEAPVLEQGFRVIAPWNSTIDYEIRKQEVSTKMTVLSSNLLDIVLDVTIFFRPDDSELGNLELKWGRGYADKMIMPSMRSVTREVIAKYLPEEINTSKRELIQEEIEEQMRQKMQTNHVILEDVLIRNIELPAKLRASIEKKLQMEQESEEYEFRIEKETQEAERKRIEAEGIQQFQKIVTQSITPALLRWKGVEATEALSNSPNSKIVIIGGGEDGLPIMLNTSD
jgi:prohibitin 1